MNAIKATVKAGRVEAQVPSEWPDGTEVEIQLLRQANFRKDIGPITDEIAPTPKVKKEVHPPERSEDELPEEGWSTTPEAIADWLKWYDALEPLIMTAEEEADTEAWLAKINACAGADLHNAIKDVFR